MAVVFYICQACRSVWGASELVNGKCPSCGGKVI